MAWSPRRETSSLCAFWPVPPESNRSLRPFFPSSRAPWPTSLFPTGGYSYRPVLFSILRNSQTTTRAPGRMGHRAMLPNAVWNEEQPAAAVARGSGTRRWNMTRKFWFRTFRNFLFRNRPYFAHLALTHVCNLRCRFCHIPEERLKEQDTGGMKRVIDRLDRMGIAGLSISGGEP